MASIDPGQIGKSQTPAATAQPALPRQVQAVQQTAIDSA